MTAFLFAAGWNDFLRILPIVVVILVWVINQFSGKLQAPQPPQKRVPPMNPQAAPPPRPQQGIPPGQQPLQAEIEEFLRQAQALREGRPVPPRNQPARPAVQQQAAPPGAGASRRPRQQQRRPQDADAKREPARPAPPQPAAPAAEPPRESVAQYVAEHIDSSKFAQRASSLSNIQKETDEFQQHMARVFDRGVGKIEKGPLGMFEAAGQVAAAASAVAATSATTAAGGAESATAPIATFKVASNIALFLAGRKNIRDAIILTEILQRPEHRW